MFVVGMKSVLNARGILIVLQDNFAKPDLVHLETRFDQSLTNKFMHAIDHIIVEIVVKFKDNKNYECNIFFRIRFNVLIICKYTLINV